MIQHFLSMMANSWRKHQQSGPNSNPCDGKLAGCKEFEMLAFNCTYMLIITYSYTHFESIMF